MEGFGHLWRPREFTIDDQSSSEHRSQTATGSFRPRMFTRGFEYLHTGHEKRPAKSRSISVAGMEGFEPPNVGTKNRCLTTWRHPIIIIVYVRLTYCAAILVACTKNRWPCHDKIRSEFFATPPQSVTFVIRLPALRPADLRVSHFATHHWQINQIAKRIASISSTNCTSIEAISQDITTFLLIRSVI